MSLLAAICAGAWAWAIARRLTGGTAALYGWPQWERHAFTRSLRGNNARFQIRISQAGAAVTPGQFWGVSAGVGGVMFLLLLGISRTPIVAALPAVAAGALPYAYWSAQRRKQAEARSSAWPDALRYLVGVLGAGIATLHEALEELSRSARRRCGRPWAGTCGWPAVWANARLWQWCGRNWPTPFPTPSC